MKLIYRDKASLGGSVAAKRKPIRAGFCYHLVEEHSNCLTVWKGKMLSAHRSWPLAWCSWCRLRTWRRCHFQLYWILSAWRPVWDTWAEGWRGRGGWWEERERGRESGSETVAEPYWQHIASVNTWAAASACAEIMLYTQTEEGQASRMHRSPTAHMRTRQHTAEVSHFWCEGNKKI